VPVRPVSRFAKLPLLEVTAPDGTRRHVVALGLGSPRVTLASGAQHAVIQGESVDLLARRYLGGEGLWWRMLDVNPFFYPFDLAAGAILNLPAPGPATRAVRTRSF
jgi:hypothetical protein